MRFGYIESLPSSVSKDIGSSKENEDNLKNQKVKITMLKI
jgi:hypothetical protein